MATSSTPGAVPPSNSLVGGNVTNNAGGSFTNGSASKVNGSVTNNAGGSLSNQSGGKIIGALVTNSQGTVQGLSVTNAGAITNGGIIANGVTNNSGGTVINNAGATIQGGTSSDFKAPPASSMVSWNSGLITNYGAITSPIVNSGQVVNYGTISSGYNPLGDPNVPNDFGSNAGGLVTNLGTISLDVTNSFGGTMANLGTINAGVVNTGRFTNGGASNSTILDTTGIGVVNSFGGVFINNAGSTIGGSGGGVVNNSGGVVMNSGTINNGVKIRGVRQRWPHRQRFHQRCRRTLISSGTISFAA